MISKDTRQRAFDLRDAGHSYNFIEKELGIKRGTLSGWFSGRPFNPNQYTLDKIRNGPKISAQKRIEKRIKSTEEIWENAKKSVGQLSQRDLLMLGIGLYFGEGTKSGSAVRIVNADQLLIKLAIRWFREVFGLKDENFGLRIHSYPDVDMDKTHQYWLSITGLPEYCLQKPVIDTREKVSGKIGKLPFGTAHLTIVAAGNPDFGVKLHRLILGYMKAVTS